MQNELDKYHTEADCASGDKHGLPMKGHSTHIDDIITMMCRFKNFFIVYLLKLALSCGLDS